MTEERCYYVYMYFRPNGIPCYVGKGKGKRVYQHMHACHSRHLRHIIAKANKQLPRLKIRENLTDVEAREIEIALIAAIGRKAHGGPLVNLTDGGEGVSGSKRTPEMCAAQSARQKGKPWSAERRANYEAEKGPPKPKRVSTRGRTDPWTDEQKAAHKIRMAEVAKNRPKLPSKNKGKPLSEETKAKLRGPNPNKRVPHGPMSDETKKKLSEARKRRTPTDQELAQLAEARRKLSEVRKGRMPTPAELAAYAARRGRKKNDSSSRDTVQDA